MFKQPNYTQIPNLFLDDVMKNLEGSEVRICLAVMRQTFGWHKAGDRISISQLMEMTGLSNSGVIAGVNGAIEKGVIVREPSGQGFTYSLAVSTCEEISQLPVRKSHKQPVRKSHTQKKEQKKDKEIVLSAKAQQQQQQQQADEQLNIVSEKEEPLTPMPPAPSPKPLTEQQRKFQLLCSIVGWDHKLLTKEQAGQIAQTLGVLVKAGYGEEHLKEFFNKVWSKDWRWTTSHSYPTLNQVRAEMGKLKLDAVKPVVVVQEAESMPHYQRVQEKKGFYN